MPNSDKSQYQNRIHAFLLSSKKFCFFAFIAGLTACQSSLIVKSSPLDKPKSWCFWCPLSESPLKPTQRSCFANLPAHSQSTKNKVFLVAAGANTGEGERELTQTPQDIKLFTQAIKQHFSVPEAQICQLENVYRQEFEMALMALHNLINPNDLAIIYFSGHGSRVRDDNGDEEDRFDEILITYDVKLKGYDHEDHALRDDRFVKLVNRLPTDNVITVMDSCFSGGMQQTSENVDPLANARLKFLVKGVFGTQQPNRIANHTNVIENESGDLDSLRGLLWAAAREAEYSLEIPKQGGLFTTTLVEQLAKVRDLRIAFEKTKELIRKKTQSRKPPQTPEAIGDWGVLKLEKNRPFHPN